jgi:hypothetical protein
MRVESRAETSPNAANVCRLSLVTENESTPPLATLLLQTGDNLRSTDFTLAVRENRVHLKAEGLQLRTRIGKVVLVRVASSTN